MYVYMYVCRYNVYMNIIMLLIIVIITMTITKATRLEPVEIIASGVCAIAAGSRHSLAVTEKGEALKAVLDAPVPAYGFDENIY